MKLLSYLRSIGYQSIMIGLNFIAKKLERMIEEKRLEDFKTALEQKLQEDIEKLTQLLQEKALKRQLTALDREIQEDVKKLTPLLQEYTEIRRTDEERSLYLAGKMIEIAFSLFKKIETTKL